MRGITSQRCREDERSVEVAACLRTATTDDAQRAQRWVGQILFERCVIDGWPEPARTCFTHADVHSSCDELLPESARTSLREHLVDMAESLGVPY